ncbi:MAG: GIY-YIG nuclease family protein [Planctomycetota bacterium]|nr:GIY-YIG nuclease family protein [Planctomycetota bacterium]
MKPSPKTIQIFLPAGDPQGIRVAEITTRIVQVLEVPRKLYGEFAKMPVSQQVGIYALFSSTEDTVESVYIGQSGDLRTRLGQHDKSDRSWDKALIVVSNTNSLTQTHALFLEFVCIRELRSAGRYSDSNGNSGTNPHTPAPLEADCMEIFETASTLITTLGYPLFEPIARRSDSSDELAEFLCNGNGSTGRGTYTQEGFVVFKGSSGPKASTDSLSKHSYAKLRPRLISEGAIEEVADRVVFLKDYLFASPSAAAVALLGRSANGRTEWKTENGQTLDEVLRQADSVAQAVE